MYRLLSLDTGAYNPIFVFMVGVLIKLIGYLGYVYGILKENFVGTISVYFCIMYRPGDVQIFFVMIIFVLDVFFYSGYHTTLHYVKIFLTKVINKIILVR